MTICIAALADNGSSAVLVTDQLNVIQPFSWGINSPGSKIHYLDDNAAVLAAGDLDMADEIVRRSRFRYKAGAGVLGSTVYEVYAAIRDENMERFCLRPRGFTLEKYINENAKLHPILLTSIDQSLRSFDIGVRLITVERVAEQCTIAIITNPALLKGPYGFVSIGDGDLIAFHSMLFQACDRSMSVEKVENIAREAKRESERSPLVGKETTVCYVPKRAE